MQAAWQQAMGGGLAARAAAVPPAAIPDGDTVATPRSWWRTGLRVARDVAIGFALVAAIPLTTIVIAGAPEWSSNTVRDRVVEIERVRPLGVSADPGISPIAAGGALHRLAPPKQKNALLLKAIQPDELPWMQTAPLAASLFVGNRSTWWQGPGATHVIERAANGFTTEELAWLRRTAEAPLWRDVELVARAKQIDIQGAMLSRRIDPTSPDDAPPTLPMQRLRQIAEAGVARAAYYVTQKDYARAEAALRTVVSLGFALVDNGTSFFDAVTGRVIVDIGRSGLHQLATVQGRPELLSAAAPFQVKSGVRRLPIAQREAEAVAYLADASLPRSFRYEQYGLVTYSACTSVPRMLVGPSAQAVAAMEAARRTLPRFPSEQDMLDYTANRIDVLSRVVEPHDMLGQIINGAAAVTSAVTGNPRIETCTRLVTAAFSR